MSVENDYSSSQWSGAKVVVIGASGFLGTTLCRRLVQAGAVVRGVSRGFAPVRDLRLPIEWRSADTADLAQLLGVIQGEDIVFHFAGDVLPTESNLRPADDLIRTTVGTINLLTACAASNIKMVIYASSGGTVYGRSDHPVSESSPTNPITAYGISKLASEKYFALFHYMKQLNYRILRITNPFGPNQVPGRSQGVIASLLKQALIGSPLTIYGNGEAMRDYVYVDDLASACLSMIDYKGPSRLFNVGSGVGRTINQIVCDIELTLKTSVARCYLPLRVGDLPSNVVDSSLIRSETGWQPRTPFREGLMDTLAWMKAEIV